ncbi:MAG: UDP-N-acetylmuramoyl-L-alanyl-D-glutamate--2,6-diaminopimelate ligase, partial [Candidatus Eisenbacteria bacterium]|nr:UDP-N-acetylmuramoyl-L-alanyl-D-glutamate--2,6-diaminopimelate ligase [Candidatus Eisenbacteria bacterium]
MILSTLVSELPQSQVLGESTVDISGIEFDSRQVGGGALFVCLEGLARNGHDFAAGAVSQGAVALVVRYPVSVEPPVPQVVVPDTREAMARLAATFYGHPSRELKLVGVTGTNGKTTVTQILQQIAEAGGVPSGVFGTLGNRFGNESRTTGLTTPEAPQTQAMLRLAVEGGTRLVAMEASSHAIAQKRTFGLVFAVVVFTNLTRDHLDYHGDFETYKETKFELFDPASRAFPDPAIAILNLEDPAGRELMDRVPGTVRTYGFHEKADYRAAEVKTKSNGSSFLLKTPHGEIKIQTALRGRFNVLNALAAAAAASELGIPLPSIAQGLEGNKQVPGRMEPVDGAAFQILVDYAHTPDALSLVLEAVKEITSGRVLLVFGCGGDRDAGKRPEMGQVASRGADLLWVTSDNPRTEDPEKIIDEILAGVD